MNLQNRRAEAMMEDDVVTDMMNEPPTNWLPRYLVARHFGPNAAARPASHQDLYLLVRTKRLSTASVGFMLKRVEDQLDEDPSESVAQTAFCSELVLEQAATRLDPGSAKGQDANQLGGAIGDEDVAVIPLSRLANERGARPLSVGRSASCDLLLRHASVSKVHALIEHDGEGMARLTDVGSRNGTLINGKPAESTQGLASGDTIQCGVLRLHVVDAELLQRLLKKVTRPPLSDRPTERVEPMK